MLFVDLWQLIAHYHNKTDGLLCKLTMPCERSGFRRKVRGRPLASFVITTTNTYNYSFYILLLGRIDIFTELAGTVVWALGRASGL